MKVYISGPITGVEDYMENFAEAEKRLKEDFERVVVINPAKVNYMMPEETTYEEFMRMAFCMLEMCDTIYMLKGWEKSCGANREYCYALAKDYTIIME